MSFSSRNILTEAAEIVSDSVNQTLERLKGEIASSIDDITEGELRFHSPGKWCIAEVLEHLYLTYTGTLKGFERMTAAGHPLATAPTLKQRLQAFIVVGLGYMPSGRDAPRVARPRGLAAEMVLADIGRKVGEMDAMIARCEKEFGEGKLLDHPFLGPLSGHGWRKFHFVHGRHHLKQIRQLRKTYSPSLRT